MTIIIQGMKHFNDLKINLVVSAQLPVNTCPHKKKITLIGSLIGIQSTEARNSIDLKTRSDHCDHLV